MLLEDNSMGRLAGPAHSVVCQAGGLVANIEQALTECDIFAEEELRCRLEMIQLHQDIRCGRNTTTVLEQIEVCSSIELDFFGPRV